MLEKKVKMYKPKCEAIGVVQILHGMAEYKERYEYFINKLNDAGYVVVIHDHLGHGKLCPKNELGYFKKNRGWKALISEAMEVNVQAKKVYPKLPFYLFAHSMGSILARSILKRYDKNYDGVILCGVVNYNSLAPIAYNICKLNVLLFKDHHKSKFLDNLFLANYNRKFEGKNAWLSKNEENVEAYNNDELCGFSFTNKAYEDLSFGLMDMNDLVRWKLSNKKLPILLIAGSKDPCIGGKKAFVNSATKLSEAGYLNVSTKLFKDLRHEILNEKERDDVINFIIDYYNSLRVNS